LGVTVVSLMNYFKIICCAVFIGATLLQIYFVVTILAAGTMTCVFLSPGQKHGLGLWAITSLICGGRGIQMIKFQGTILRLF
jgi:hypothetical protein